MLIRRWIQERDIAKRLEGLFLANIPSICLLTPHSILVITDTSVSPGSFNLRAGKPWVPLLQCTTLPGAIFSMSVFNDRGGLFSIDRLESGGVITNYTCTSRCAHCLCGCSPGWPKEYMDRDMLMRVLSSKHEKRPKGIAGLAGLWSLNVFRKPFKIQSAAHFSTRVLRIERPLIGVCPWKAPQAFHTWESALEFLRSD